jgi:hypothetical protein
MNNNTILAIVFLMAGTLLTIGVTSMVPAAYAGEDNGNKNKAEDESNAALADCDDNDVEQAGFDCFAIAGDEEGLEAIEVPIMTTTTPPDTTTSTTTILPDMTTDGETDGTDGETDGTDGETDGTDGETDGTDGETDGTDGETDGTDGETDGTDGE